MKITSGGHKILFSCGKLYLDGVQIAGEGIIPSKDIMFDFQIKGSESVENGSIPIKNPPTLEINVFDEIPAIDLGPGQRK